MGGVWFCLFRLFVVELFVWGGYGGGGWEVIGFDDFGEFVWFF